MSVVAQGLGVSRLPPDPGRGDRSLRRQHLVRRDLQRRRRSRDPRRGDRDQAARRDSGRRQADPSPADASPSRPRRGPALLRAALARGHRAPHLGAAVAAPLAARPHRAGVLAAALSHRPRAHSGDRDIPRRSRARPGRSRAFASCALPVSHPGTTVGYRLELEGASLAFIPDHEPVLGVELASLAAGVDLGPRARGRRRRARPRLPVQRGRVPGARRLGALQRRARGRLRQSCGRRPARALPPRPGPDRRRRSTASWSGRTSSGTGRAECRRSRLARG